MVPTKARRKNTKTTKICWVRKTDYSIGVSFSTKKKKVEKMIWEEVERKRAGTIIKVHCPSNNLTNT